MRDERNDTEAIKVAVARVIHAIEKPAIKKSTQALVDRIQRCINAEGTYFE